MAVFRWSNFKNRISKPRRGKTRKSFGRLRWSNIKIRSKYGFALIIMMLLFIVSSGFVTSSLFGIKDAVDEIQTTAERSIDLTEMSALFREKELIILDYVKYPRNSLVNVYGVVEKKFIDLQNKIEPKMDTEELRFQFGQITKNSKQIDDIFKNNIVTEIENGDVDEASMGLVKISGFRNSTMQLLNGIKDKVDEERRLKMDFAYENIDRSIKVLAVSVISALAFGMLIVSLISRNISRNLNMVVDITNKVSDGELNIEEIKYEGKDEIGQLSEATNKMLHRLHSMVQEIVKASNHVNDESNSLRDVSLEVQQGSEQIAATMEEMAAGAEEQASSANEISSSINNLTKLIDTASNNKDELQKTSKDILIVVQEGTTQMQTSIEKMNHINNILADSVNDVRKLDKSSEKISAMIQIINNISEETNLLALNAAIEAARAGEAGRGFAVVAEEIRKLSEQVGQSVSEITEIVTGIQVESKKVAGSLEKGYDEVLEGTTNIETTGEIFDRINKEINTMIQRINSVSQNLDEISINSATINTAGDQIAAISQENSAGIEETVASVEQQNNSMETITENANSLANSAKLLKELISQFKM